MRTAILIALVMVQIGGSLTTVTMVGKPRQPLTPGMAAATVAVSLLMVAGFVTLWATGR
jgi:hypothetical protein